MSNVNVVYAKITKMVDCKDFQSNFDKLRNYVEMVGNSNIESEDLFGLMSLIDSNQYEVEDEDLNITNICEIDEDEVEVVEEIKSKLKSLVKKLNLILKELKKKTGIDISFEHDYDIHQYDDSSQSAYFDVSVADVLDFIVKKDLVSK